MKSDIHTHSVEYLEHTGTYINICYHCVQFHDPIYMSW